MGEYQNNKGKDEEVKEVQKQYNKVQFHNVNI